MNEKTRKDNRSQCNSRRSDVSPSLQRENTNAQAASTDNMGKRDEPKRTLCTHDWRKEEKRKFIQNNRDPYYKEEIKIPPPHPHKRKNINFFPHSKYPYFLWARGRKNKGKEDCLGRFFFQSPTVLLPDFSGGNVVIEWRGMDRWGRCVTWSINFEHPSHTSSKQETTSTSQNQFRFKTDTHTQTQDWDNPHTHTHKTEIILDREVMWVKVSSYSSSLPVKKRIHPTSRSHTRVT
jgi:hypothetical protein